VARVVEGLSRRGWAYDILSLEKAPDLERTGRVREVEQRLARAGVTWHRSPYDWSRSGGAAVKNLGTLARQAVRLAMRGRVRAIHARAYHGAFAGLAAWTAAGLPYVFDARSYWIDEKLEEGRWFTTPVRLGLARGLEHQLFARAAGVVTLTELQASDVRAGRFGANGDRPVVCVPTTADYEDFRRRPPAELTRVPAGVRARLAGKLVLAVIGSINRSYLVDETLDLARRVMARRPDAHLLILSGQQQEYEDRLVAIGVDTARVTQAKADHDAMPQWMSLLDWCLLLLNPASPAKRASVPTKLAELFASGVRPAQFGCNAEVSEWVRRAGSGFVLPSVEAGALEDAARRIAEWQGDAASLARAREITAAHFSLQTGLERYDGLWRRVLGEADRPSTGCFRSR